MTESHQAPAESRVPDTDDAEGTEKARRARGAKGARRRSPARARAESSSGEGRPEEGPSEDVSPGKASSGKAPGERGSEGTEGAGRTLGVGAAIALGAAAAAGLVSSGRAGTDQAGGGGDAGGGHPPAAPPPSGAPDAASASSGDQGYAPAAATDPAATAPTGESTSTPGATASTPGDSSGNPLGYDAGTQGTGHRPVPSVDHAQPGNTGVPATPPGQDGTGLLPGRWPDHGAGRHGANETVGEIASQLPGADADWPGRHGTVADWGPWPLDGSTPPGRGRTAPILYDSSGHPIGTVDDQGRFLPLRSGSSGSPVPAGTGGEAPPVLYDSSGRPVALLDTSGHVVPISGTTGTTGDPVSRTDPGTQASSGDQGDDGSAPQYEYVETQQTVQLTDDQISEAMLSLTPEERTEKIKEVLAYNDIHLSVDSANWPKFSDDFWSKSYTYMYTDEKGQQHTKYLDPLTAATTVVMLTDTYTKLKTDIGALSTASHQLESKKGEITTPEKTLKQKFSDAVPKWQSIIDRVGDPNGDIGRARSAFLAAQTTLFGGDLVDPVNQVCRPVDGNFSAVANTIGNFAAVLGKAASQYVQMEQENLRQFNIPTDNFDPRSQRDKDRYVNGEDMASHYPPGYFDTNNPSSPYYKQK